MLTSALLFCYEVMSDPKQAAVSSHIKGLSAILLASASSAQRGECHPNELARSIVYCHSIPAFCDPISQGQPSLFDNPWWLTLELASQNGMAKDLFRLKKTSHQLFIQLPGLISRTRSLREGIAGATTENVIQQAAQLAGLQDIAAEDALLHLVRIVKTMNPEDSLIVPFSFNIKDLSAFEALSYYWQTRIMINRLCARIKDDFPHHEIDVNGLSLRDENVRMAVKILMSLHFGLAIGQIGHWALSLGRSTAFAGAQDVHRLRGVSKAVTDSEPR